MFYRSGWLRCVGFISIRFRFDVWYILYYILYLILYSTLLPILLSSLTFLPIFSSPPLLLLSSSLPIYLLLSKPLFLSPLTFSSSILPFPIYLLLFPSLLISPSHPQIPFLIQSIRVGIWISLFIFQDIPLLFRSQSSSGILVGIWISLFILGILFGEVVLYFVQV